MTMTTQEDLSKRFLLKSLDSRLQILEERLAEIEEEIQERKRISDTIMERLQRRKEQHMGMLNDRSALRSAVEGENFYERRAKTLKKMERIDEAINREMEQQWRDIQQLTRERRELREKREELRARRRSVEELLDEGLEEGRDPTLT